MCVYSNKPLEKKIAEKDIEVYKLLRCDSDKLYSSYASTEKFKERYEIELSKEEITWKIGETKTTELGEVDTRETTKGTIFFTTKGLYSFPIQNPVISFGSKYKMFKAIIPAGSEYYEGINDEYCSNSLKIIEEVCV